MEAMDDYMEDDLKDSEFDWDALLRQTNLEALPEACLPHVHKKANLILQKGMKIEMSYMDDDKTKYWVATVIMSLGPVVRLRFLGDDNPDHDKWKMIKTFKPLPLGWCKRCSLPLTPPSYLSHVNVDVLLGVLGGETNTVQEYATFELEQFVPGMKLEIEDEFRPYRVWLGNILENYGGRLQLRYDAPNPEEKTFWLFYTSRRIHPYGWAKSQGEPWVIEKPSHIDNNENSSEAWAALFEMNLFNFEMECKISHIKNYKYEPPRLKHEFTVGTKLEATDPRLQVEILPATVVHIFDAYYFLVQIDERDSKFLATLDHPYIFPMGWAKCHGIQMPQDNTNSSSQEDPLKIVKTGSFQKLLKRNPDLVVRQGMKLEAVNPLNRSQMCVGTILCVCQDLVRVQLDMQGAQTKFWFDLMDCEVFPLGWSKATGHAILPPTDVSLLEPKSDSMTSQVAPLPPLRCIGCEKATIYLNHKCFTGPFLSKSKLAALPKVIGPGPVKLVLMDVVKRIANLAYVQMRILRELEAPSTKPPEGRTREELKVKYKKRVYKGTIELATRLDGVKEYCKEICGKLQVCPNLISLTPCPNCPLNCSERNKVRSTKDKKAAKQSIDYKSFIFRPLKNPLSYLNRTPFQEDIPQPKETSPEEVIVWNKEKCLRKRKVNVYLEREKKRLKINNDEETASSNSKGKESEENSAEEETRKNNQEDNETGNHVRTIDAKNRKDIFYLMRSFTESKLPLPTKPNPLQWTEDDVFQCVSQIPDLCTVAPLLKAEAIDGLALTLLNLHLCRHNLHLDIDTSLLLCRLVEVVRARYLTIFIGMNHCAQAS